MPSYDGFCQALMRKHEMILEEATQEAALNTEVKQVGLHGANESEQANAAYPRKGGNSLVEKAVVTVSGSRDWIRRARECERKRRERGKISCLSYE